MDIVVIIQFSVCSIFRNIIYENRQNNTLKFLLKLQLSVYNLLLYLKDLCNKEIDCLSKIKEKKLKKQNKKKKKKKKKKTTENVWSVGFIPLGFIPLETKN